MFTAFLATVQTALIASRIQVASTRHRRSRSYPRARRIACVLAALLALPTVAAAQTTVVLDSPGTEVTDDTTIRGGGYASANYSTSDTLATKNSSDSSNVRRILLKFNTAGTVPAGAQIQSATLYLSLKSAGTATPRTLGIYWVSRSFLKDQATWYDYRDAASWNAAGGDFGTQYATFSVGTTANERLSVDVTSLVQDAVNNTYGSRYARIGIKDVSSANDGSLREFYSSRASDSTKRPKLVVEYGSSPPPPTSGTTLKVMTYNTHHGVGTDGRYDLARIARVIANQRPDIVGLNEVMYNSSYGNGENQPATYKRLLEDMTGDTWSYVYARMDGDWSSTSWAVGNVLLTRHSFRTTTRYVLSTDRHSVAQGTIVINGRTINVFTTHVSYDNATWRAAETRGVRDWAATWAQNRVVIGDFNTRPGTSDYATMDGTYSDTWAAAVSAGTATSPSGSSGYTRGSSRFDYIWKSDGASNLRLRSVTVPNTSSGGVYPSDHDPVVAVFDVN